jgi:putative transposase
VLHRVRLLVRADTVLRWHRELIAAHHAWISRPKRVGRRRTVRSIRLLVLRLARENSTWGYRRIHGELLALGIKVAASTVWEILKDASIDPAPQRSSQTWATFLRSQAEAILAADFFETVTLTGKPMYVLAVIEHATRRVRILGATAHPTAAWVTQVVRNLAMDLHDAGSRARFLIRDRDGKYPAMFDTILADAGIKVVPVRVPRMNAIMEGGSRPAATNCSTAPWSGTKPTCCTRYASTSGTTTNTVPIEASRTPDRCKHCPNRSPTQPRSCISPSADATVSAASCTNTNTPHDLHGRRYRHPQGCYLPVPGHSAHECRRYGDHGLGVGSSPLG